MQNDIIDTNFQTYYRTLITRSNLKTAMRVYSDRFITGSYCLDAVEQIPTSSSLMSEEYVARGKP